MRAAERRVSRWQSHERLWSLWEMLQDFYPIYAIALRLQSIRTTALFFKDSVHKKPPPDEASRFRALLHDIRETCTEHGMDYTSDMAKRIIEKPLENYADIFPELDHLNGSLSYELQKETIFRIPPERKGYFEQDELFGSEVGNAFPSCSRNIQKAGDCYALEQEDACIHHLMLVVERGLNALAVKVGADYERKNWQVIIDIIGKKVKALPGSPEKDLYLHVNAQFGFFKDAYRNHSEHARDELYDMERALSILNHVRTFMHELQKGGLSES